MEKRVEHLSDKELLCNISRTGWVSALPSGDRALVDERFDRIILAGIESHPDIPAAKNLARTIEVGEGPIQRRITSSIHITKAIKYRCIINIQNLSDSELLEKISNPAWSAALPGYARKLVNARFERIILAAIEKCEDMPTTNAIASSLGISMNTLTRRANSKRKISEAIERKFLEYIGSLTDEELFEKNSNNAFVKIPHSCRELIYARMVDAISRTIERHDGIPTIKTISEVLGLAQSTIIRRMKTNPALEELMRGRTQAYIDGKTDEGILEILSDKGMKHIAAPFVPQALDNRLDGIIQKTIREMGGVPTVGGLVNLLRTESVRRRVDNSASLQMAMKERGEEYINGLSEAEVLEKISEKGWVAGLPDYAQNLFYERFDAIVIGKVTEDHLYTSGSLAKKMELNIRTIQGRMGPNPAILKKMEAEATNYVQNLPEDQLLAKVPRKLWRKIPPSVIPFLTKRIDIIIQREIEECVGMPSARSIGRAIGLGGETIQKRINDNPILWKAFSTKKGLSPDQAVELALERGDESESITKVLNERLRHLHAFREMVGLIRCFGDILQGKILTISLYPDPLSQAAEELGIELDVNHQPMKTFRGGENTSPPKSDVAIVQGMHRLKSEGLTRLLMSVRGALRMDQRIIATFSSDYAQTENFADVLRKNGLELMEAGFVEIIPPDKQTVLGYGVTEADSDKVMRKISGHSRVLVMKKKRKAASIPITALEKNLIEEGKPFVPANAEVIDTPEGIANELSARFISDKVILPSGPFLVNVLDGEKPAAVLGYDMDPKRRNRIEAVVYPGAPNEDYRGMARQLARDIRKREKLGIAADKESVLPLRRLHNPSNGF